jgi:hypothetical protein
MESARQDLSTVPRRLVSRRGQQRLRLAGIQQTIDLRAIFGPLLDLVEIAVVRLERVVSFLVGLIIHA